MKKCPDCGIEIDKRAKRCRPCYEKIREHEIKNKCIDCGKHINSGGTTRCRPCFNKWTEENKIDHKYCPADKENKKVNLSKLIIQTLKEELANVQSYQSDNQTKVDKKGDTLVIHLTDFHAGKIVKNESGKIIYDENIFRQRIDRLCTQILKLLDNNISE